MKKEMKGMMVVGVIVAFSFGAASLHASPAGRELTSQASDMARRFDDAAREFDVPVELLQAIGYSESRWKQIDPEKVTNRNRKFDHHNDDQGDEHPPAAYGVMGLRDDDLFGHSLRDAAALIARDPGELQKDAGLNIRGAAALLRQLSGGLTAKDPLEAWAPAVERLSGIPQPAIAQMASYDILNAIRSGRAGSDYAIAQHDVDLAAVYGRDRAQVLGAPRLTIDVPARVEDGRISPLSTDYAPAIWNPAASCNYTSGRTMTITHVTIHVTQGSYASTISWFQNCSASVSAHYVVRSSDGQVTQMVREADKAWHVGSENGYTVGIEHEGYVADSSWFTDAMYNQSALLTRDICNSHGISTSGVYDGSLGWNAVLSTSGSYKVKGHVNFPNQSHTDPGQYWNWSKYRQLVLGSWSSTVDNSSSRFRASGNWALSSYSTQRYGADYRYANPQAVSDAAWYSFPVPSTGNYEVYVWYPANSGYNSSTPFVIATSSGNVNRYVNQQTNGGTWVSLGTFSIAGGDHDVVGISRWSSVAGYVIADAVRLVKR